jgi:hypothetical protein
MLKNNSSLTWFTALLAMVSAYLSYCNYQSNQLLADELKNMRHAIYYRLNIDINAPDSPQRGYPDAVGKRDAVLTRKDVQAKN